MINFVSFGTSLYAGIAVFSIIGFMAHEQRMPIDEVINSGRFQLLLLLLLQTYYIPLDFICIRLLLHAIVTGISVGDEHKGCTIPFLGSPSVDEIQSIIFPDSNEFLQCLASTHWTCRLFKGKRKGRVFI